MLRDFLTIALFSFLLGIIFIVLLRRFPLKHKIASIRQIPLSGGLAIAMSFFITCLFSIYFNKTTVQAVVGLMAPALIVLIIGIIDDWRELSVMAKLLSQIISAALLIALGVKTEIVYIGSIANIVITLIWVVGITNAFNHIDIMDGLAAGAAIIISLCLFAISYLNHNAQIQIITLALAGSVLGFLVYNFTPAKIYMGNAGSHFLGFLFAAVSLKISYATLDNKTAILSPIFIMGFLIFDTVFLILIRLKKKKLPYKKSNDHMALRFLALGYSKRKIFFIMTGLCLCFCLSGVLLSQVSYRAGALLIVLVFSFSLVLMKNMSKVVIDG